MSLVRVNSITNINNKKLLNSTGNIVQVRYFRTDIRNTWSAPNNNIFTPVTSLTGTIIPKNPANLLLVQVKLAGEIHHDTMLTILRDYGVNDVPYSTSVAPSNNLFARWAGMISGTYVGDDNGSTPHDYFLQGVWEAQTISEIRFTPGVKSSSSANYTLFLNRTQGSTGTNSHEICTSHMIIYEISRS